MLVGPFMHKSSCISCDYNRGSLLICLLTPSVQTFIFYTAYEECVRDKLVDRTATYLPGKVLKLDRWAECMYYEAPVGNDGRFLCSL